MKSMRDGVMVGGKTPTDDGQTRGKFRVES